MKSKRVPIDSIYRNPQNPRQIKDDHFMNLVKSLKDFPEMMTLRPVVVNKNMMILGGNMRYEAAKEAGWTEIDIIEADLTPEQEQEFIIKDNSPKGASGEWSWDDLANDFAVEDLLEWGFEETELVQSYTPQFKRSEVTNEQIEKKARELAVRMVKEWESIEIICPKCGHEFEVKP